MPDEILAFYQLCGGLKSVIRTDDDVRLTIATPGEFSWAVKEIIGSLNDEHIDLYADDMLWYWYIVGRAGTDEYFVIDLAPERYGRCYFTELYFFGQRGWTPL